MRTPLLVALATLATGCTSSPAGPVSIDFGNDVCSHCRMAIVSTATAAQIVAPGDEPILFDDLGCLRDYVAAAPPAANARIFVADHRTSAWVDARQAVFTRTGLDTPMGSGLVTHVDSASRDQDPQARNGTAVPARSIVP